MSKLGFEYKRPSTIQEAIAVLQTSGARVIAGGTDLMIELKEHDVQNCVLVDITSIPEMTEILVTEETVEIGAAVSFTDISLHPVIRREFTALAQAASLVGSPQIRNRGTIGGNLSTGSSAGDSLCPLTAFCADLVLVGSNGEEIVNIADFWTHESRKKLSTETILSKVILRRKVETTNSAFIKLGRRESLAISRLSVALVVSKDEAGFISEAAVAIGSAGRHAYSVPDASSIMVGKTLKDVNCEEMGEALAQAIRRALGSRATAPYKAQAVKALCRQALVRIGE